MARKNGFDCPWHATQVFSFMEFILFHCLLTLMHMHTTTIHPSYNARPFLTICFILNLLLSIFVVIQTIAVTKSDPVYISLSDPAADLTFHCQICDKRIPDTVKHCQRCNKCIQGFDHHCVWLNNCIGKNNYRIFAHLLGLVFVQSILQATYVAKFALSMTGWKSPALWVYFSLLCIKLVAIITLVSWNLYLYCVGLTTYEYMMKKEIS